jgi:hypothetical protein
MTYTIVFVSLAGNQSKFFAALEPQLQGAGHRVVHICFHEGAAEDLRGHGHRVFNAFKQDAAATLPQFSDFGIEEIGLLLSHEKAAYELHDTAALTQKFRQHLGSIDSIFEILMKDSRPLVVVQELGGFTSVLATFYAARRRGIDNYFIEPSFFKGRFFFTQNSFRSPLVPELATEASDTVLEALNSIRASRTVVIPAKDKSHYRGVFRKIMDPRNIRRLVEKVWEKYILRRQEEFHHIGGHVRRHLRMLLNSMRLRKHYEDIPKENPFIYYPLHVPADFALTVRSPEYLDQLSLIDYLCRVAPVGHNVVIKEHPALVGSLSSSRVDALMARHDNLLLLRPTINNHRVLEQAEKVVTVNSKAGAEALLYGKPVIVLGDAFYRASEQVTAIDALRDVRNALNTASVTDIGQTGIFFENVWRATWPGELYDLTPENITTFAASLTKYLSQTSQFAAGSGEE